MSPEQTKPYFASEPCPSCNGTGEDPETVFPCRRCHGVGRILDHLVQLQSES